MIAELTELPSLRQRDNLPRAWGNNHESRLSLSTAPGRQKAAQANTAGISAAGGSLHAAVHGARRMPAISAWRWHLFTSGARATA
jgi:hypothetical protein